MSSSRWVWAFVVGMSMAMWSCKDEGEGEGGNPASSDDSGGAGETFGEPDDDGEPTAESGGGDESGGIVGDCSIYAQDCPSGEKCTAWSEQADLVPDENRCCPEDASARQPGDECTVQGYFGSCIDDCARGSLCLDLDGDGSGICQKFCEGSAENPQCEADQTCLVYFNGVPFCFDQCDPLVQDCGDGQGCYPDEATAGGTGFICLPIIGGVGYREQCWLLSGCQPGLICVSPDFIPDCLGTVGCCTSLCDTSEADNCADLHPDLQCVSWYYAGQAPPSAGLDRVGACVIPPS